MTRQRRSTRCWHRNDLRFREGGYSPSRKKSGESRCSDADGKKKIASRPAAVDAGIAVSAGRFCADGAFCALSAGSEYLDQLYRLQCHPEPTQCMGRPPELSQPAVRPELPDRVPEHHSVCPGDGTRTNGLRTGAGMSGQFRPAGTDGVQGDLLPAGHHLLGCGIHGVQISVYVRQGRHGQLHSDAAAPR